MNETKKHPLWRNVVLILERQGANYSTVLKTEWLEQELHCLRETAQFGLAIDHIRRHFEHQGMHLTARDQKGEQFVFVQPNENYAVVQSFQAKAVNALKRGLTLGSTTPLDSLTGEEKKRHEHTVAQIAVRAALIQRPVAIEALNAVKRLA